MPEETFRIGTFNIRFASAKDGLHSWWIRKHATKKIIASLNCAVLGLQEVEGSQLAFLQTEYSKKEVFGLPRDGKYSGERCSLIVDKNFATNLETQTCWYGETPESVCLLPGAEIPRIYTRIEILTKEKNNIVIYNTHLDHSDPGRRSASMNQLLETIDISKPTIILGDFNEVREGEAFTNISKYGIRFTDPNTETGTFHKFKGGITGKKIDHILVSEHFEVLETAVYTKRAYAMLPSDHWPVTADLRLT